MSSRSFLLLAIAATLGLSTVACTALSRPEEITISAEPLGVTPPAPQPQPVATMAPRAPAAAPGAAAPRGAGTG